ncbi:acetate--CoA ligase family protein [Candidatus Methanoliparum sp. LAM-1]|uniref:acetate--CoA ligase family protein n=1 Tax=Candidatus Methanoliparum sp. LAM-1 TaxID=2874846 RepID=UPI001E5DDC2C|nr:CoA-binding protein [Candidatus Methanoliparum sp. LAM-1]BDC35479.1 hypothetical protein MTLP_01610 [Candidatus Methanoliparum sp. LAM-1]
MKNLEPLFNPRSIAVIGATNNINKWGFSTFLSIVSSKFKGDIYPVNIKEEKILGYKAFKRVTDIPGPVDLAIFVIPGPNVPTVMEDCVEKGIKAAIIISAGFAEMGEEGKILEDEVLNIARKGNIPFVGPNCMGMWSASSNLVASMFPILIKDGPFAFVSQGGWLGVAIAESAYARGIGFHRYVSCGRAIDIQIEDYIEYFGNDPEVKVIMAYIEGLNDGRRFIKKVKEVTPKKPVVVLKPGKSEVTARAIMSHSGAFCGVDEFYDTAFKKSGVIRVKSEEELLDVSIGFLSEIESGIRPKGRNVAIITEGGSVGVVASDFCAQNGLNVIELSKDVIDYFNSIFPPRWSHGNPIDPAGDRNFVAYLKAIEKVLELNEIDSLILVGMGGISHISRLIESFDLDIRDIFTRIDLPNSIRYILYSFIRVITTLVGGKIIDVKGYITNMVEKILFSNRIDINEYVSIILNLIGPTIGYYASAGDEKDAKEFVSLINPLINSIITYNKKDIVSLIEKFIPDIVVSISSLIISKKLVNTEKILEMLDYLLGMLVLNWVQTYKKPIFTTLAFEGTSRLIKLNTGVYFPYPNLERGAITLAKLVEYEEYLERLK